jgi:hypothetical protein
MAETLCDWSKHEIRERAAELHGLTREPTLFCRKCARVANKPRVLCKPERFEKWLAKGERGQADD